MKSPERGSVGVYGRLGMRIMRLDVEEYAIIIALFMFILLTSGCLTAIRRIEILKASDVEEGKKLRWRD